MAIRAKDIYEGRKKSRGHVGVIVAVILTLIAVVVFAFYGLREYAVYDENGNATIVLPWSKKVETTVPTESTAVSPSIAPTESSEDTITPNPS
ncbi:MAG: hypothetical protein KBI01_02440 [Oscillospiraceae bacterium]|nr:hypothetical protein [Oscillospiraceae bacterium]